MADGIEANVSELPGGLENRVNVEVRGKRKEYLALESMVEIPGLDRVKLVISKGAKLVSWMR